MILLIYLVVINVVAFVIYGVDKAKAIKEQWRIPEATLIGAAAAGGGVGAFLGMSIWRHKTRKWKFRILVPLCIVIWIVGLIYLYRWGYVFNW